ncbi:hypothetical protein EIP91_004895 [Steccherinum ochraceum]|uniref:SCP domain-containing protein n=1 Tax=Steccherinum ochraceum TaxID=92696 RepID=A0A4R0RJ59_9APHY|nr:hypothetical protein EIP91_004895 [Steccherinum ochraceum]
MLFGTIFKLLFVGAALAAPILDPESNAPPTGNGSPDAPAQQNPGSSDPAAPSPPPPSPPKDTNPSTPVVPSPPASQPPSKPTFASPPPTKGPGDAPTGGDPHSSASAPATPPPSNTPSASPTPSSKPPSSPPVASSTPDAPAKPPPSAPASSDPASTTSAPSQPTSKPGPSSPASNPSAPDQTSAKPAPRIPPGSSTSAPTSTTSSTSSATHSSTHPPIPSPTTGPAEISQYLIGHNAVRAAHGAAPLTWSDDLAEKAHDWASECQFEHTSGQFGPVGENLVAGTGSFSAQSAVDQFTDEALDPNGFNHLTQVLWKATTQIGCGVAQCSNFFDRKFGPATFHVCFYNPVGNVIGQEQLNVQL